MAKILIILSIIFIITGCNRIDDISETKDSLVLEESNDSDTIMDSKMETILDYLKINKNVQIATVSSDGKPSIRTIWFQFYKNGRLYFQTDIESSLYQDLSVNPNMEFISVNDNNTQTLRVSGEVRFDDSNSLIEEVFNNYPEIEEYYRENGNPKLIMFYPVNCNASIFEFSSDKQEFILIHNW